MNEYKQPKPRDKMDIEKCTDMLICMAVVLNVKLDGQKSLNITKVSSKLYDWITYACREDEEAFDGLIKLGQEMDARLLHQDPAKESAWKKILKTKKKMEKGKKPKKVPMVRRLQDKDFKEIMLMALYDHTEKWQWLYFHDVDIAHPKRNTLEYVSMHLRQ